MSNPCVECPFRRKSPNGWIGGHHDPSEILHIIALDQKFPCHQQVNAIQQHLLNDGDEDDHLAIGEQGAFDQAVREARHCVGALAFMNNTAKLSRDPTIARQQRDIGKREDVFATPQEMLGHHRKPMRARRKRK